MNRKMKRTIKHDKSFVNDVMNIINKYFPKLFDMFTDLTDLRHQSYITYNMKTICVTRFIALICGIKTMHSMSDTFNNDKVIDNISSILSEDLSELPHYDTINDVFEKLDENEIRKIQKYIAYAIIRSKMFDLYRFDKKIQLIFDGTGLVSFDYKHCDHCLVDSHKDGTFTYKHMVLEAKMCFGNILISLDSEFIDNPDPSVIKINKQDCEINAFKRLCKRIKKNFPKLAFIVSADSLYAAEPFIKICLNYNWDYIFTLKATRLQTVNEDFSEITALETGSKYKSYYLLSNYSYRKVTFNIVRFHDELTNNNFTYITNLFVNDQNIKDIITLARKRWKIENEGFNEQKNGTFNINHMCSLNYNAMKIHYLFIQFAHTIRQLFDKGRSFIRELKLKIKEVSQAIFSELTSTIIDLNQNLGFQLRFDMLII